MEKGTVKFFDSRDNKRFGFIRLESGEEIFFHYNDFMLLFADDNGRFNFYGGMYDHPSRTVHNGDVIYFERSEGSLGREKASPWCFQENYRQALADLAKRPHYRVLKQTTVYGNSPSEPEVLWEGTNIDALVLKYPRPSDHRMDDLWPTFSCGDFEHKIWFERKTENGWESCDDPRPVEQGRRRR